MESGNWRGEAWPGPDARARQRLPRVDDLPAAEHGYERERVREAFDSFYRHIAQLDSTLRALEAVEVFRDQAGELRRELRALKAAGWTQQPWPSYGRQRVSPGLPEALPRFAIEAAFLIIVAVVVAVAGFDRLSIVLVMALAWAIVGLVEWAASRERFARARVPAPAAREASAPPPAPLRIVPADTPPAESWSEPAAAAEPSEGEADDERTIIRPGLDEAEAAVAAESVAAREEPVPALEPAELEEDEPEPVVAEGSVTEAAEAELEAEVEPQAGLAPAARWSWAADSTVERAREREQAAHPPQPRRRFWQRRKRDSDDFRFDAPQPRHVRVLPPEPSFDEQFPVDGNGTDPWEQDFDLSIEEPEGAIDDAPHAELEPDREAALDRREP